MKVGDFMGIRSLFERMNTTLKHWEAEAAEKQAADAAAQQETFNANADLFINGRGDNFHCSDRQYERFQRACSKNQIGKIVSLNKKKMSCKICSSSNASVIYKTTLNNCDCEDFSKSGLPCKHVYKLALELGIIEADWDISGLSHELKKTIDALLYSEMDSFLKLLVNYPSTDDLFEVKKREVPERLIETGLVTEPHGKSDFYRILDESYYRNDIFTALTTAKNSYTPNSASTKTEMISWILDNDEKLLNRLCKKHYYIRLSPEVYKCKKFILRQYRHYLQE